MQAYLISKKLNEISLLFEQVEYLINNSNTYLEWEGQARKNYDKKNEEIKMHTQFLNNYTTELKYDFYHIQENTSE